MARRSRERTRTVSRDQVIPGCPQQAGDVASLAFRRVCRSNTGALAWLTGFRAGFYGASYVWPLGTLDPQVWAIGFIEGRGSRR